MEREDVIINALAKVQIFEERVMVPIQRYNNNSYIYDVGHLSCSFENH